MPWFIAGCALTAVSLIAHLAIARAVGPIRAIAAVRYVLLVSVIVLSVASHADHGFTADDAEARGSRLTADRAE